MPIENVVDTILRTCGMSHQDDSLFTVFQEIGNTSRDVFEISLQATGSKSHVAAPHMKLTEAPLDALELGGEFMNVWRSHVALLKLADVTTCMHLWNTTTIPLSIQL